jgi:hypothetical protein
VRQSTQRKALAAVLGLGVLALVLDRAVFTPGEAGAVTPSASGPAPATASTQASAPQRTAKPGSTSMAVVRKNLYAALDVTEWDDRAIGGSLRPTPGWALFADPREERPAPSGTSQMDRFRQAYHLKAVMKQGDSWVAIITGGQFKQGQLFRVGSALDGFRLIKLDDRTAVFEAGSQRVELSLPKPMGGGNDSSERNDR